MIWIDCFQMETNLKEREALLEGTVITEERFVNNVRGVIEEHKNGLRT